MTRAGCEERRDVRFHGHVQGVGFRYTARALAGRRAVTGYVQNLVDGDVRMVVEGRPAELDDLIDTIQQSMARYITDTRVDRGPATGEFDGFRIEPGY